MFVDLIGSTEMATRMDAEDMRDVITSYQNTVAGVVSRFEGFVAKFMGDGVLCYFGWPRANEDDAERSVRAGLSIIEAVRKINAPDGSPLSTRVGIATGVVIVGDLIGSGATQEAAVVGETPNLAARLQGVAGLNQLVIARETQRLLGTLFDLTLLDGQDLKRLSGPVDAYQVEGEATVQSRFAARRQGSKLWELRVAVDLAHLWQEQGRIDKAVALLEAVHSSIAEGDCPDDCATARAMLREFTT